MFNKSPKIRFDFNNLDKPFMLMNNVRYSDEDTCFSISRGYHFDGLTIPRPLWGIVGSKGDAKMIRAALAHDYMCERKKRFSVYLSTKVFYKLLVKYGTSETKSNIMCLFVFIWQVLCRLFDYGYKSMRKLFRL